MNNNNITREKLTLYMLPHKLKWYQKILQKLHIKNYYVPVGTTVETVDLSINDEIKEILDIIRSE